MQAVNHAFRHKPDQNRMKIKNVKKSIHFRPYDVTQL